ncbi:helix-turn-helix transcriptional regulator [Hyphomicrobium sp. LHD-15]|uniref:helix-turn-helix domain-containing protein n=1 Tax=Hyphomicrobium sp. LHD-15 TaxID=3072142 RepID=UPI00280F999C|nr:helix-turn-helix transcriptional regulator [Hyphomicrobium sp. LHD-15]MDQ8700595.1 helix-turn-helix transcriptional regulator [Hyphomicrobium sp. LHD-15]
MRKKKNDATQIQPEATELLKRAPNEIDVLVGQRVRVRRIMNGLSQQGLAEKVGISFQQVQKYENGLNRISASKLHQIAEALNAPVHIFFQTEDEYRVVEEEGVLALLRDRDTVSVLRAFSQIRDRNLRRAVRDHIRNIAACGEELDGKAAD